MSLSLFLKTLNSYRYTYVYYLFVVVVLMIFVLCCTNNGDPLIVTMNVRIATYWHIFSSSTRGYTYDIFVSTRYCLVTAII